MSDAQINFFLNDPYFTNYKTRINNAHIMLVRDIIAWRNAAIELYHLINDQLGENRQIVLEIARNTSLISASEATKYVGTYVLTKGPINTGLDSRIVVTSNNNDLLIQYRDDRDPAKLMIMHQTIPWFVRLLYSAAVLQFERDGPNTLSVMRENYDRTTWVKVEEE